MCNGGIWRLLVVVAWHGRQFFIHSSSIRSMDGNQTLVLINAFDFTSLWCPSCAKAIA